MPTDYAGRPGIIARVLNVNTLARPLLRWANRSGERIGRPFDPATPVGPPSGRHSWTHYGVMVPGLPEPHRTFGVMSIVGTPGVSIFANDHAITTTPNDTAYLVSATAAMRGGTFRAYSIAGDCEFAADGSRLRFGDDLEISGRYPGLEVRRSHPDADVSLRLRATDKVTWFADVRGDLYSHWSLLCEYDGTVGGAGVSGLCTFEYARGAGLHSLPVPGTPNVPATFFSYHVLNVDDRTQVLFGEARLPGGIPVIRAAWVRGLDDYGTEYTDASLAIRRHEAGPRETPDGRRMRLPSELAVTARDADGGEVFTLEGKTNGDWAYGLGAGFVGSYAYDGTFRGRNVSGTAYMEYVDLAGDSGTDG